MNVVNDGVEWKLYGVNVHWLAERMNCKWMKRKCHQLNERREPKRRNVMSELKVTEGVMKGEWSDWKEWNVMKVTEWHARRHEFTAINEINASEEQAAQQLSDGNQFNFNSPMKGRNEIEWLTARMERRECWIQFRFFISPKEMKHGMNETRM